MKAANRLPWHENRDRHNQARERTLREAVEFVGPRSVLQLARDMPPFVEPSLEIKLQQAMARIDELAGAGDPAPCGLWFIEIKALDLRGDQDDTVRKLRAWVAAGDEPRHRTARSAFADGVYSGMRWAGVWATDPPVSR